MASPVMEPAVPATIAAPATTGTTTATATTSAVPTAGVPTATGPTPSSFGFWGVWRLYADYAQRQAAPTGDQAVTSVPAETDNR